MDANGTRFHLLLAEDWAACRPAPGSHGGEYVKTTREYTLPARVFDFPEPPKGDRAPRLEDRRGSARDRFGSWYWIGQDGTSILVNSAGTGSTSLFWRPGVGEPRHEHRAGEFRPTETQPATPLPLAGLTVTDDHFLVAGIVDPRGLLIFDLRVVGPPRRALWPSTVPFEPFDLASREDGGAWVLDRENARVWQLNRQFLVVSLRTGIPAEEGVFAPLGGGEPTPFAPAPAFGRIALEDSLLVGDPDEVDPVSIVAAPDGSVLVLDRGSKDAPAAPSIVRRFLDGVDAGSFALTDPVAAVLAHDIALVPPDPPREGALGALYAAAADGNQSYRFNVTVGAGGVEAELAREYYPMRVFGGKAIAGDDTGAYYDFGDRFIPLVNQHRPRYEPAASVLTPVLDSHAPATVWHRILLDACVPAQTTLRIWSRAAEDPRELDAVGWYPEPAPHLRGDGSELPFARPPARVRPLDGTWELLFQRAKGRYLQLRLDLVGDGRTSPRLRAMRVYYPRFSYLERYLPKAYRDDSASASFLDRFLANVEGFNTEIEDRIAAAQVLFDARSAPAETLDWLSRWFDFALDPDWPEARRRLFIRHAMDFFRVRGTVRGLELTLRLALDPQDCADERLFEQPRTQAARAARIVERFRTRRTPSVVAGDPTEATNLRVVTTSGRWQPEQGRDALHALWRAASAADDETVELPLEAPAKEKDADTWRAFVRGALGFEPAASPDLDGWARFLERRYGAVRVLDSAYGLAGAAGHASFGDVDFPEQVPADGAPLADWFQFEAVVAQMRAHASRFTVLLPVPPGDDDVLAHQQRRELAKRVVELHKPAHTTFDVKFFWSAFRVGEVRLGEDTLIDLGSRSPRLLRSAVLGREHLGETRLGGDQAPTLTDPPSLGRSSVQR